MQSFFTIFVTIFLAELGDKTQLATLLFASDKDINKLTVFVGAALALIMATAIGVAAGGIISKNIDVKYLHIIAGIGFIFIGVRTILKA
jgi:putative Ca2+/H+ antiporter (TMEM165/GDT1 family)